MSLALPRRLAGMIAAHLLLAAVAFVHTAAPAAAQSVKQIKLTEKQIQGFIAVQKPMSAITEKMQGTSDKPDPKIQAALEAVAKKHGFRDFSEYDDVAANIAMVMAGMDPQTKQFTDPQVAIKTEIAEVEADKSLSAKEKQQMLEELNAALKTAMPIEYPDNIALIKKYYDKIDAVLQ